MQPCAFGSAPPLHRALCPLQLLQRIAFKHSPELRELALLNIGSIQVSAHICAATRSAFAVLRQDRPLIGDGSMNTHAHTRARALTRALTVPVCGTRTHATLGMLGRAVYLPTMVGVYPARGGRTFRATCRRWTRRCCAS
jgi:hypothetical protein